jgi:hypothetical protein
MDDFSPQPIAPSLDFTELPDEPAVDERDKALADQFFASPVEALLLEEIESIAQETDEKLPSDEFKVEELSKRKAIKALTRTLARIKDAVETVESVERTRTKGGK